VRGLKSSSALCAVFQPAGWSKTDFSLTLEQKDEESCGSGSGGATPYTRAAFSSFLNQNTPGGVLFFKGAFHTSAAALDLGEN
jgi:hypothetical protein